MNIEIKYLSSLFIINKLVMTYIILSVLSFTHEYL